MKLEERYIVIKLKHLTSDERDRIYTDLESWGVPTIDCVVIEKDWPEYDPTVNLLWERINEL